MPSPTTTEIEDLSALGGLIYRLALCYLMLTMLSLPHREQAIVQMRVAARQPEQTNMATASAMLVKSILAPVTSLPPDHCASTSIYSG